MLPPLPPEPAGDAASPARPSRGRGFFLAAFIAAGLLALASDWLGEERRDLDAWAFRAAVQRGVETEALDYLRLLPRFVASQWRAVFDAHDWSLPVGRLGAAALAILWLAGIEALGFGLLALLRRRHPDAPAPPAALTLPLGFALSGAAIMPIAVAGLIHRPLMIALVALVASTGAWRVATAIRACRAQCAGDGACRARRMAAWRHPMNIASALALGASLLYALAPATQSDGVRYHLGALGEWIKAGRLAFLPNMAFAQFPFLVEIHWLPGLAALGDPIAGGVFAQAIHWGLFAWSLFLLSDLAAALLGPSAPGDAQTLAARFARFAWATVPSAIILGGWCFIDHGIVAFFLASLLALAWASDSAAPAPMARALIAGTILGGLVGTKYTMLAIGGLGGLWLVGATALRAPAGGAYARVAMRACVACALGAALTGGPWLAKNWALAGNPLYPATAGGVFKSPGWSDEANALLASKMSMKGWIDAAPGQEPWKPGMAFQWATVATRWRSYEGQFLGMGWPLGLLLLVAWAALWPRDLFNAPRGGHREAFSLWCAALPLGAAFYVVWSATYLSARLLMPLAALGAACAGAVAGSALARGERGAARVAIGAWWLVAAGNAIFAAHWFLAGASPSPLPVALGFEPAESHLARSLNYYPLAASLNSLQEAESLGRVAGDAPKALLVGEHRPYYFNGAILFSDWFDPPLLGELLAEAGSADELLDRLERENVRWIGYNRAELSGYLASDLLPRLGGEVGRQFLALLNACEGAESLPIPPAADRPPGETKLLKLADVRRVLGESQAAPAR